MAGLAVAAAAFLAVTVSLPARPAPDASGVAGTIDDVSAGEAPATATQPLPAGEIRLGPHSIAIRTEAGTSRATFAFGSVTPVPGDGPLRAVLRGKHPAEVFEDEQAFRQAVVQARSTAPEWQPTTRVQVRGVSWDGYRVTLVGA